VFTYRSDANDARMCVPGLAALNQNQTFFDLESATESKLF